MSTPAIIDLSIAAVLLIFVIIGLVRGLIKSVLNFIGTLASVIGAAYLSELFTPAVTEFLWPKVKENIIDNLDLSGLDLGSKSSGGTISSLLPDLSSGVRTAIETLGMNILTTTVRIVLFIVLFILCLILVKVLAFALGKLFELPVLNTFNRAGGALFGLVEGMLIVYLIIFLAPKLNFTWFTDNAEGTLLLNFFLNVSPLEWIDFLKLKSLELMPEGLIPAGE